MRTSFGGWCDRRAAFFFADLTAGDDFGVEFPGSGAFLGVEAEVECLGISLSRGGAMILVDGDGAGGAFAELPAAG